MSLGGDIPGLSPPIWNTATDRGLVATSVAGGGGGGRPRKENHWGSGFGSWTPALCNTQAIISTTAVKIFSADLSPNGRAQSTYALLSHEIARKCWCWRCSKPASSPPSPADQGAGSAAAQRHPQMSMREVPTWQAWDRCQLVRDAIADTVPKRKGQVHNHPPLAWLRFGN